MLAHAFAWLKTIKNTGMPDLIITSYKLTINMSSYFQEYIQYPVDYYTYNRRK